jgi:transposase
MMEVVQGRSSVELEAGLRHIPGRTNVQFVIMDLCESFRGFAKSFFPKALLVADKFHVLRLLFPAINRRRREITGNIRTAALRRLLLKNGAPTWPTTNAGGCCAGYDAPRARAALSLEGEPRWLLSNQRLQPCCPGPDQNDDKMSFSELPEIQSLRRTLMRWRFEILAYFASRLTNGRTEGFNNKAKVVKRRAYGYRSFRNYRLHS